MSSLRGGDTVHILHSGETGRVVGFHRRDPETVLVSLKDASTRELPADQLRLEHPRAGPIRPRSAVL